MQFIWSRRYLYELKLEVSLQQTLGVRQIGHAPNWNIDHLILIFEFAHEDSW